MSRFITFCHKLSINTGKLSPQKKLFHEKIDIVHYPYGDIGDDYHYILMCSAIKENWKMFLKSYFLERPKYTEIQRINEQ